MTILRYICRQCHLIYEEAQGDPPSSTYARVCPRCGDFNEPAEKRSDGD